MLIIQFLILNILKLWIFTFVVPLFMKIISFLLLLNNLQKPSWTSFALGPRYSFRHSVRSFVRPPALKFLFYAMWREHQRCSFGHRRCPQEPRRGSSARFTIQHYQGRWRRPGYLWATAHFLSGFFCPECTYKHILDYAALQ